MKRKNPEPPQARQHKGRILLTQLAELQAILAEFDPQPAAGKTNFSYRRRSA